MAAHRVKSEILARLLLGAAILLPLAGALLVLRPATGSPIEVHARMAEDGGWGPSDLAAEAGIPMRLRLTSDDVVHGFAIGRMEEPSVEVLPGQYTEVSLTFDRPGRYTFYCTRWCGPGHWRMRGTVEVTGEAEVAAPAQEPLYVTLGLDIDAPHLAPQIPARRPSAAAGASLGVEIPDELTGRAYYESRSPYQAFERLRSEPSFSWMDDDQVWDAVALVWRRSTTPQALESGARLFAQYCAACHGERGDGEGVMAGSLQTIAGDEVGAPPRPADFTFAESLFGASPALLEGKILRGGMGTGMPYFGPILTEAQIRSLVDYLWTFTMEYSE